VTKLKLGIGDATRIGEIEQQAHHLVAVAPDGPWGYAALGYLHMERGDMAQSIKWFRKVATIMRRSRHSSAQSSPIPRTSSRTGTLRTSDASSADWMRRSST